MNKRCAMALIAFVAVYVIFAFMKWDIDAGNWEEGWRVTCALLAVVASGFAATLPDL